MSSSASSALVTRPPGNVDLSSDEVILDAARALEIPVTTSVVEPTSRVVASGAAAAKDPVILVPVGLKLHSEPTSNQRATSSKAPDTAVLQQAKVFKGSAARRLTDRTRHELKRAKVDLDSTNPLVAQLAKARIEVLERERTNKAIKRMEARARLKKASEEANSLKRSRKVARDVARVSERKAEASQHQLSTLVDGQGAREAILDATKEFNLKRMSKQRVGSQAPAETSGSTASPVS